MSAYGDYGDDGAAAEATAEEAAAADCFTVTPAQAATLRAAHPAKAKGPKQRELGLRVLSNRAELISGGDALVEVVVPDDVDPDDVRVEVDGRDVTSAFALRADGTFSGLVDGLALGANDVVAGTAKKGKASGPRADDQEPPGERAGLLGRAAAAVGLRPAGSDPDRRHDPGAEPDGERSPRG